MGTPLIAPWSNSILRHLKSPSHPNRFIRTPPSPLPIPAKAMNHTYGTHARDYIYVPTPGRPEPTYSFHDLPSIDGPSSSIVAHGWCRLSYSKIDLPADQEFSIRSDIVRYLESKFKFKRVPKVFFPAPIKKQRYVDICMEDLDAPFSQWNAAIHFTIPSSGASLQYFARGCDLPAHFTAMSLSGVPDDDKDDACRAVSHQLRQAQIVDVWQQVFSIEGDSNLAAAFTGTLHFLVELFAAVPLRPSECSDIAATAGAEPSSDPDPGVPHAVVEGLYLDTLHDTWTFGLYSSSPAPRPDALLAAQLGWTRLESGKELKLLFRGRKDWCSICRSRADYFHSRKHCPDFVCNDCGKQGHFRNDARCPARLRKAPSPAVTAADTVPSDVAPISEAAHGSPIATDEQVERSFATESSSSPRAGRRAPQRQRTATKKAQTAQANAA